MLKPHSLIFMSLLIFSFSSTQKDISGKYVKPYNTGSINLEKSGSFFIQQIGGGTGAFETKGKWVLNMDTVHMNTIQNHVVGEPWKKRNLNLRFLYRRDSLISFSYVDKNIKLNLSEAYKRAKRK